MRARARIHFHLTDDEFWELTPPEWNAYCHVANEPAIMLDKQLAEVRHMIHGAFSTHQSRVEQFRLLQEDDDPAQGDFFDAIQAMIL